MEEGQQNEQMNNNNNNEGIQESGKAGKKKKQYYGKVFVGIIAVVIIVQYYCYVFEIMVPNITKSNFWKVFAMILVFNLILIMMLWSFYTTMSTHPGEIPLYWGFYIGDDDYKRKRYCLICNAFKPERSHHCSICNVCILNMDHHCPWVDNCIGFCNRKFFMMLLFYLFCLLIYYDISALYFTYLEIRDFFEQGLKYEHKARIFFICACYGFILGFSCVITMFYKFHLKLVINNSTTIESLEKEHPNENLKFKLSKIENWHQVFGTNKWLWFIPLLLESGRPEGDGLSWKTVNIPELQTANNAPPSGGNTNAQQAEMQNYNSDHPLAP